MKKNFSITQVIEDNKVYLQVYMCELCENGDTNLFIMDKDGKFVEDDISGKPNYKNLPELDYKMNFKEFRIEEIMLRSKGY